MEVVMKIKIESKWNNFKDFLYWEHYQKSNFYCAKKKSTHKTRERKKLDAKKALTKRR